VVSFGSRIFVALAGPVIGFTAKNHGFSWAFSGIAAFYLLTLLLVARISGERPPAEAHGVRP